MLPVGDKVVLREAEVAQDEGGIVLPGGEVFAEVIAVGKGIPFGRGEFYEPVLKEGDLVFVSREDWGKAPSLRLRRGKERPEMFRVLHERQVLVQVEKNEL